MKKITKKIIVIFAAVVFLSVFNVVGVSAGSMSTPKPALTPRAVGSPVSSALPAQVTSPVIPAGSSVPQSVQSQVKAQAPSQSPSPAPAPSASAVPSKSTASSLSPSPIPSPGTSVTKPTVSPKSRQEIIADEIIARVAKRVDSSAKEAQAEAASTAGAASDTAVVEAVAASEPALIEITSPDGNGIVYVNTYSICGVRDDAADLNEKITLFLTRFDGVDGDHAEFIDTDGGSGWVVSSNGVFTQSVQLEEGDNRFAIAACGSSVLDGVSSGARRADDILDSEIQVVRFTITYRSQNVAEKIGEVVKELSIANILNELEKK